MLKPKQLRSIQSGARSWLHDTGSMLGLVTRLPVAGHEPGATAVRALPVAGAIAGAIGGVILAGSSAMGLPTYISSLFAVAGLVMVGGGLHEDGLADTADGFGGGKDAQDKLRIMRDSTIGSYGVIALTLTLMARVSLLAALMETGGAPATALMLISSGAISRAGIVFLLTTLAPARQDGLGGTFAAESPSALRQAMVAAAVISGAVLVAGLGLLGLAGLVVSAACTGAAALAIRKTAKEQIGGQTGDVCGATQQAAEIATLAGLLVML